MIGQKLAGVCLALVIASGLLPQGAFAQATVNPTKASFDPSPDHNATNGDGTPVVQSYQLGFYLVGASAPFQTNNLGKPTPGGTGTITVDLTSMLIGWPVPGTNYFAEVKAVGAGGLSAGAQSNQFSFSAPCTYAISPASQAVAATGSTASVAVTAPSGCAWTAVSNTTWITVTSGLAGAGNGTVGYSVAANPLTGTRTGTVLIAGQTFTITQSAAPCNYSISPTSQSVVAAGASSTTAVTTTAGCTWTSTSNDSWISITGGASGTGNGTVSYDVAANTLTTPRTGSLTVAGQTVTVLQSELCVYTLSSTSQSVPSSGATRTTTVTTTSGCSWTATSNAAWITVTGGSSGTGSGTVTYVIAANTGALRSATLTIAGQTVTVSELGFTAIPSPPTNLVIRQ